MQNEDSVRINKFLAHATGMARREADLAIGHGRVAINGKIVDPGARVSPGDAVTLDGRPIAGQTAYRYVALYKPVGYVCSRRRQGDTPTIYELLPDDMKDLKPVGRLDRGSSGLLLLTDDGDFAHRMTHPSFAKRKVYEVTLDHDLAPLHQQLIKNDGIDLEDGRSRLTLERLIDGENRSWRVTMHEGRNRQIRRTFAALGYDVTKLHRTDFGPYVLDDLQARNVRHENSLL